MRGRAPSRPAGRRLGRAEAACACVRVCVAGDPRGAAPAAAGWAPARPERRDGRLAGAQALLRKHTSPRGLRKWAVNIPRADKSRKKDPQHFCFQSQAEIPLRASFPCGILACPLWAGKWKWKRKVASPHHKIGTLKTTQKSPNNQKPKFGGEAVKWKGFFTPIACHPSLQKGLWMCSTCHCSTAISVQDSMHVCRAIILSKTFL